MNQQNSFKSPKMFMQQLTIIFFAMCGGLIILACVFVFLKQQGSMEQADPGLEQVLLIAIAVVGTANLFGSSFLSKYLLQQVKPSMPLKTKLDHYFRAKIIEFAMIEGFGLFAGVGYFLTGNNLFLIGVGLSVGYLFFLRPSIDSISQALSLSTSESSALRDPGATF